MSSIPQISSTPDEDRSEALQSSVALGMLTPSQTRRLLHSLGTEAKKRLGQHFLVDRRVRTKLLRAARIGPEDLVVEIGPGLGALTGELARRARQVVAIEKDEVLAARLRQALGPVANVQIITGDVLGMDPAQIVEQARATAGEYKVVADLPYNIASAVVRHFLEAEARPQLMVVMVQREVAESMAALPGQMSLLSVAVQLYGKPSIAGYVSPQSFYPPPRVESAILRIETYVAPNLQVGDVDDFFRVVRAGFSARRKQLHNSLAQGLELPPAETLGLLVGLGIDPQRRAQTLSLDEWSAIYHALRQRVENI